MQRLILGTIKKTDGSPVINAMGIFTPTRFSYGESIFYSNENIYFWTNKEGEIVSKNPALTDTPINQPLGINLICTNVLDIPINYTCVISDAGIAFDFVLPSGNTPIRLEQLAATTIEPEDPRYTTLITVAQNAVNQAMLTVVLDKSKKLITRPLTAITSLSALRIIKVTTQQYADCRFFSDSASLKGFTESATTINQNFTLTLFGSFYDNSWAWDVNRRLYLGYNGFITQNLEPNATFLQEIGVPVSNQEVFIDFQEPILL